MSPGRVFCGKSVKIAFSIASRVASALVKRRTSSNWPSLCKAAAIRWASLSETCKGGTRSLLKVLMPTQTATRRGFTAWSVSAVASSMSASAQSRSAFCFNSVCISFSAGAAMLLASCFCGASCSGLSVQTACSSSLPKGGRQVI